MNKKLTKGIAVFLTFIMVFSFVANDRCLLHVKNQKRLSKISLFFFTKIVD